jgi:hypothetical protein
MATARVTKKPVVETSDRRARSTSSVSKSAVLCPKATITSSKS